MELTEAIEWLKEHFNPEYNCCKQDEVINMAICAMEKQIPKKPKIIDVSGKMDGNWEKRCPACGKLFVKRVTTEEYSKPYIFYHAPYCECSQKIDWSE